VRWIEFREPCNYSLILQISHCTTAICIDQYNTFPGEEPPADEGTEDAPQSTLTYSTYRHNRNRKRPAGKQVGKRASSNDKWKVTCSNHFEQVHGSFCSASNSECKLIAMERTARSRDEASTTWCVSLCEELSTPTRGAYSTCLGRFVPSHLAFSFQP
jgi:hypothetical protein